MAQTQCTAAWIYNAPRHGYTMPCITGTEHRGTGPPCTVTQVHNARLYRCMMHHGKGTLNMGIGTGCTMTPALDVPRYRHNAPWHRCTMCHDKGTIHRGTGTDCTMVQVTGCTMDSPRHRHVGRGTDTGCTAARVHSWLRHKHNALWHRSPVSHEAATQDAPWSLSNTDTKHCDTDIGGTTA
jgi:hypothetical protein